MSVFMAGVANIPLGFRRERHGYDTFRFLSLKLKFDYARDVNAYHLRTFIILKT